VRYSYSKMKLQNGRASGPSSEFARRAVNFRRTKSADRSLDPSRDFFSRAGDGERNERRSRATHIDLHSAHVLAASTCCGQLAVIIRRSYGDVSDCELEARAAQGPARACDEAGQA